MSETPGKTPGNENAFVPEEYILSANEVSFANAQILLPATVDGLSVSVKSTGQNTGILTISLPVEFLKSEGQPLGTGEIGVKTGENIANTSRGDSSRFRVAWDPVERAFVEVTIPINAFKKLNSN